MSKRVDIIYGMNIMWFEYGMIAEHFESVKHAYLPLKEVLGDSLQLELRVWANKQTYMEKPDDDMVFELFEDELKEALLENPWVELDLTWVTDDDPFFCMADVRRELRNPGGWAVWGEIDCLLPARFFKALYEAADNLPDPTYALTFAYRKMWDPTWNHVEHPLFRLAQYQNLDIPIEERPRMCVFPYDFYDYISQEALDGFNANFQTAEISRIHPPKLDGSLLAFYGLEDQLIPDDMHFGTDDLCAMVAMDILGIPQYHIINIIKGHNYKHPLKRLGTPSTRDDEEYKRYKEESQEAMKRFWSTLREQEGLTDE